MSKRNIIFTIYAAVFSVVIIAAMIILFAVVIPTYKKAQTIGTETGKDVAYLPGIAVGSYQGITQGLSQGYEAGKQEGLSANDTQVTLTEQCTNLGKLEVLEADAKLLNKYTETSYEAIFVYKADITFSVDLKKTKIKVSGKKVTVTLPQIEGSFVIEDAETEKLAEWQNPFPVSMVSEKDSYEAYINSMGQLKKKSISELEEGKALIEEAKQSAIDRVTELVETICGPDYQVNVAFESERK